MKKGLLIFTFFLALKSFGQPAISLYAFSQTFVPGMSRERDPKDTKQYDRAITYMLYMAASPKAKIIPTEVWVNGDRYAVTEYKVVPSPVRLTYNNAIIVPKTSMKVLDIEFHKNLAPIKSASAKLKKMIKEDELVFGYTWSGKKYYKSVKKITELETIHEE